MARLRKVSPSMPGWTRRRAGRGFTYLDSDGGRLTPEEIERIRALVIPPAWQDVWICPVPNGHLQAVGTDDAGRRQYLYHPDWRAKRDRLKFDRILTAAAHLPQGRRQIRRDLATEGMPLPRAAAVAVRMLDLGCFRIGSDAYADANGSFGLTTLERRHVRRVNGVLRFRFTGKSGIEHTITIDDGEVAEVLDRLRARRSGSPRLLAYRDPRWWVDLDAGAVNAYLSEVFGGDLTAKDFRTWHGTVLAAASLAESEEPGDTKASRNRAVRAAVQEVADYLGNTVAIARGSYIDPRVIDLYENGTTMTLPRTTARTSPARRQVLLEAAVRDLLG